MKKFLFASTILLASIFLLVGFSSKKKTIQPVTIPTNAISCVATAPVTAITDAEFRAR